MPRPGAGTRPAGFDTSAALAHLRAADPVLAGLLDAGGAPNFEPDPERASREHYAALLRAIVGQQLSTKVAAVIWGRLLVRFDGRAPTPQQVLDDDPDELRTSVGLSRAKTTYLRSLAEHVLSGELDLDHAATLSDEELIVELTAVKGLGEWTAHMFLMFQLERPDVLAVGDLGVELDRHAVELGQRDGLVHRAGIGDRAVDAVSRAHPAQPRRQHRAELAPLEHRRIAERFGDRQRRRAGS